MNIKEEIICKFTELEKIFKEKVNLNVSTILIEKNREYLDECLKIIFNKTFNKLPIEIIDNIFSKLSIKELYRIRNICKYWQIIIGKIINKYIYYVIDLENNKFSISFINVYTKNTKKTDSIHFYAKDRNTFYDIFYKIYTQNIINKICLITYNYKFLKLIRDFDVEILEFCILYNIFNFRNDVFFTSKHYKTLCQNSEKIEKIISLFKNTQISLCFSKFSNIGLLEKNSILNKVNVLNLKYIENCNSDNFIELFDRNIELLNKINILIINHYLVDIICIKYKFKKDYTLNFSSYLLINEKTKIKYFEQILILLTNNSIIKSICLPDIYSTHNYTNKLINLKLEKILFIK